MKWMVGIAVIAVFACALFLVPHASAQKFEIVDAWVEPLIGEVGDEFAYYVKVEYIEDLAHWVWCNVTLTYGPNSDKRDCNGNRNKSEYWQLPKRGDTKIIPFKNIYLRPLKSCDNEFKNFTEGRGKVCKWEKCWYNFTVIGAEGLYHNASFPKITLPEPKTKLICPGHVAWCEDFIWTFYVEDKMGGTGNFQILVDNLPLVNGSVYFPPGGGKYTYPEGGYKRRPFNESMVCNTSTVVFNYTNYCHDINKSCRGHVVSIPPPEIKAYLDEEVLSEERNNTIYLEENTNLTFKAKIEDYVEANASLKLDVYKNNGSYWNCTWNNRTIKVTPDVLFERECDIPFKKERNNFTLNLSYSRLNEINETFSKTYSLNIIPLSIKFENVCVEPKEGYWDGEFKYSVEVNASRDLDINLSVYDPCREPEPWIPLGEPDNPYTEKDVNRPKKLNWTSEEPFEKYCVGRSKFYFGYLGKETQVFFGPDLIKPPPEFNNGTTNPNVTIYCNWSKSSTPCNFSVNVSTEDEYKYKVRLLVKDPSNDWIPKGDVKDVSSETKNITWTDITPFESINIDNITQYIIGRKQANFTFEYDGHRYEEKPPFPGPELVAAFKDSKVELEPGDEVINYNDTFYYSVNVTGSEKLINITLRYLCDGKWISDGIDGPTKEYNNTFNWTTPPLNWTCKAINTWEEVRFDVNVTGEGKPIKVY